MPILTTLLASSAMKFLGPIILKAGAPILVDVIKSNTPDVIGKLVGQIAAGLGVEPTPEAIAEVHATQPDRVETVIREVASAEEWAYWTNADNIRAEILKDQAEKGFFAWAWMPAGMWLTLGWWGWMIILLPIINMMSPTRPLVLVVDVGTAVLVTTTFWGLYMGGHTVKDALSKWTGNKAASGGT